MSLWLRTDDGKKIAVIATEETKQFYDADVVLSMGSRADEDSIARIEYAKQLEQQKELNREAKADDELAGLPDSVRLARLQNTFGVFADAMIGEEGSTVLENELIESVWPIREGVLDMSA